MSYLRYLLLCVVAARLVGGNLASAAQAQSQPVHPPPTMARDVPARSLPVPETVSPQMQAIIAQPLSPTWNVVPATVEECKTRVDKAASGVLAELPRIREALGVSVAPTTLAGVKAFVVTPRVIAPRNRDRVLLHFHGGFRVLYPGESGTREAILLAGFGVFKVISVDYRMPPDFPFPAA